MKKTKRKKILIIERYDPLRRSLAELLVINQFKVYKAKNGNIGLQLARKKSPDLVICARSFSDNNCLDILQELRKEEPTRNIPFIFLSSKPAGVYHQKMNEQEFVFTLIKPFPSEALLELINQCINQENGNKSEAKFGPEVIFPISIGLLLAPVSQMAGHYQSI